MKSQGSSLPSEILLRRPRKGISQRDILTVLKAEKPHLRNKYGVLNIGLFGSYAKGTQHADSDIDFLVELEAPRFDWIAGLQIYLEEKFGRRIELVRKGNKLNRRLMERIGGGSDIYVTLFQPLNF
ncbi:MAG TPA: nucleotidyltransferase domain-containing protein [Desulfobacterales bacterium]|nr:nucleotidyltransferase domain-containing protein [Desulfobacterales bacterium]